MSSIRRTTLALALAGVAGLAVAADQPGAQGCAQGQQMSKEHGERHAQRMAGMHKHMEDMHKHMQPQGEKKAEQPKQGEEHKH
jgi:hypothetical protein